jgi:hypothetical protein
MATSRKSDIVVPGGDDKPHVVGRRFIRLLEHQLRRLHEQPAHGNRSLFADHVLVAHLLAFFNPAVSSLRTVEDVFEHEEARQRLRLPRVPKSTLADAQRVFDLSLLQPLVADLLGRVGNLPRHGPLDAVTRAIVAVDATVFQVASRIAWAVARNSDSSHGAVQMCLHYEVINGTPLDFSLISGRENEITQLATAVAPDRLYLMDRAYQSYDDLNLIIERQSDFVVRLRSTAVFVVQNLLPLSVADRGVGVFSDAVVRPADRHHRFRAPVRLVEILLPDQHEPVRLLTNRLDLPAETIGLLYRHRWQIELFFRWLKCVTQFQHFLSESPNGMALQLYVAVIGTLLIALETGSRPSKYDYVQMTLVASGMVTAEAADAVMARRRAERARAAKWQAEYRTRKKTGR